MGHAWWLCRAVRIGGRYWSSCRYWCHRWIGLSAAKRGVPDILASAHDGNPTGIPGLIHKAGVSVCFDCPRMTSCIYARWVQNSNHVQRESVQPTPPGRWFLKRILEFAIQLISRISNAKPCLTRHSASVCAPAARSVTSANTQGPSYTLVTPWSSSRWRRERQRVRSPNLWPSWRLQDIGTQWCASAPR